MTSGGAGRYKDKISYDILAVEPNSSAFRIRNEHHPHSQPHQNLSATVGVPLCCAVNMATPHTACLEIISAYSRARQKQEAVSELESIEVIESMVLKVQGAGSRSTAERLW